MVLFFELVCLLSVTFFKIYKKYVVFKEPNCMEIEPPNM